MTINRRQFMAVTAAATAVGMPVFGQEAGLGTLRLVPSTDLVFLDPVFSTALVSVQHGYHVFDTLFGVDAQLQPQPQMAESAEVSEDGLTWTVTLRDGLMFHDGEPVRAADCIASLERWGKKDVVGRVVAAAVDRYEVVDDKTFTAHVSRPFPLFTRCIGKPHSSPAFIMPERLAKTPHTEAITEMVGSGPYRFLTDEWNPGSFVAYERFEDYVPRNEPAEWTSGGKVARFARVEWHVIRDQSTAVAALRNGEVDWMESMSADLLPLVQADPSVEASNADPLGTSLTLRFNHQQPPFNNPALRRFVMKVVNQADYTATLTAGNPELAVDCPAMFPCTLPGVEELGKDVFGALLGDPEAMKAELEATGYNGERVVIINASDSLVVQPLGLITADALQRAGLNVDLQEMDWGTMLERRTNSGPVEDGGWSIYHSAWPSIAIADPMQDTTMRGEGMDGWAGWYESAEMERLVSEWIYAESEEERATVKRQIHELALNDVPSIPLGIYRVTMAYRADLEDVLPGSVRYPWGIHRSA